MKTETVVYPAKALDQEFPHVEIRLYITEEEMLNLVSLLTSTMYEYRTKGIEYEFRVKTEVVHREVGDDGFSGKGELVIRFDRPKR